MDFSNYADQGLQFGKTVRYEVTELVNPDGSHPALHVEHLGAVNASLMEEQIARAGEARPEREKLGVKELEGENRSAVIRHCARRLENAFFSDGTLATDAAIEGFVRSMPSVAFARLLSFVVAEKNFCKFPIAEKPAALAEK